MNTFLKRRGPGLLVIVILLLGFVGFMFSRGGLEIQSPESSNLRSKKNKAAGSVEKVYDGDTVKVRLKNGKRVVIRILGIDCPESKENDKCHQDEERGWLSCEEQIPLGQRAGEVARNLLLGDTVTLRSGTSKGFKQDVYDRRLAYIHMGNNTDFGLEMIRRGQCRDFSHRFEHPRMEQYQAENQPVKPLE